MNRWFVAGLFLVVLVGDASGVDAGTVPTDVDRAIRRRAGRDLGCSQLRVEAIGGRSYEASGCGKSAAYICQTENTGAFRSEVTCVLNSPITETARSASAPTGQVARRYDERRELHVITARFDGFPKHTTLEMVGAPQAVLDRIQIKVEMPRALTDPVACERFAVRVNDQPFVGTEIKSSVDRTRWKTEVKGQFTFDAFRPLARRHSTFGVDFCGEKVAFTELQLNEFRKFLEIFSQVAQDVQAGQLDRRTESVGDTVSL